MITGLLKKFPSGKVLTAAVLSAAAPLCGICGAIPIEWNITNTCDVPYELELDRQKIAKIANIQQDHTYTITATRNGKKADLPRQHVTLDGIHGSKTEQQIAAQHTAAQQHGRKTLFFLQNGTGKLLGILQRQAQYMEGKPLGSLAADAGQSRKLVG